MNYLNSRYLWCFALLIILSTRCKKINYEAVFAVDNIIHQIQDGKDFRSSLQEGIEHPKLPAPIQEHLAEFQKSMNTICPNFNQPAAIIAYLDQVRAFLLYRRAELPNGFVCSTNPKEIFVHQLQKDQGFQFNIHGFGLNHENILPKYERNGTLVDIPKLYTDGNEKLLTIRLNGSNGLPIDENVAKLIIGLDSEYIIPVHQFEQSPFTLSYQSHLAKRGWLPPVYEGTWTGSKGEGLRMESFSASFADTSNCKIRYRVHQQDLGNSPWQANGQSAGITGEDKRIEAIWIELYDCDGYQLEYQGHVENVGDTEWVKMGDMLGSLGSGQRLEALRIKILATE